MVTLRYSLLVEFTFHVVKRPRVQGFPDERSEGDL